MCIFSMDHQKSVTFFFVQALSGEREMRALISLAGWGAAACEGKKNSDNNYEMDRVTATILESIHARWMNQCIESMIFQSSFLPSI
jgi:hypothetical protein